MTTDGLTKIVLEFPCRLGRDPLGMPTGPDYVASLRAGYDNTQGSAWNVFSPKSGRTLHCLSSLEAGACLDAILDPQVLDVREQYPMLDPSKLHRYREDPALPIPRSRVPTFDVVTTRLDPDAASGVGYQAGYVKYVHELGQPKVGRRIDRDLAFCQPLNWAFRVFTEREYSDQRAKNARAIVRRLRTQDINGLRNAALDIAPVIRHYADGQRTLEHVITLAAAKTNKKLTPLIVLDLVAAGVLFGYLRIDLDRKLWKCCPLVLSKVPL